MFKDLDELRSRIRAFELAHIEDAIVSLAKPAIHINRTPADDDTLPIASSKLGGLPDLPASFAWPYSGDKPLTFIGQFKLSEIAPYDEENILPKEGVLFFFFEADDVPWGEYEQRDGWHIAYVEDENTPLVRTSHPTHQGQWMQIGPLPSHQMSFERIWTLPLGEGPWDVEPEQSPMQYEAYWDMWSLAYPEPRHHLLGHPFPIQGSVLRECVIHSQQIKPDPTAHQYTPEQLSQIQSEMQQWQFLFQIDSDTSLDVMWGDMGTLYVCMPKASLAAHRFEDCWTIMQCS